MIFGTGSGTNANSKTLFTKYAEYTDDEYNDSVGYFKLDYSPRFWTMCC